MKFDNIDHCRVVAGLSSLPFFDGFFKLMKKLIKGTGQIIRVIDCRKVSIFQRFLPLTDTHENSC